MPPPSDPANNNNNNPPPSIFDTFEEDEPTESTPALSTHNPTPRSSGPSRPLLCFTTLPIQLTLVLLFLIIIGLLDDLLPNHTPIPLTQTYAPTTPSPTAQPSLHPTAHPSAHPSAHPTAHPSAHPSAHPTTSSPVIDPDQPVYLLSDPRYGPDKPVFSPARIAQWKFLANNRSAFGRTWKLIRSYNEFAIANPAVNDGILLPPSVYTPAPDQVKAHMRHMRDQLHAANCANLNASTPRLKYHEPDWPSLSDRDGKAMARHFKQYQAFLADYYELPGGLPMPATPGALKNLQAVFARAIARKKLVLGFQGSSVMSGQDNCHYWIYSETMQRHFAKVLAPFKVQVEARNMGQNGDGADQMTQLLFAPDVLGDVDIISIWYPMMPNASPAEQAMLIRRWIVAKAFVHLMTFEARPNWNLFADFSFPLERSWEDHDEYNLALHWGGGWEGGWEMHGDGRCHLVTRENQDGVWMQNWHFGPIGFQMLGDTAMNVYLEALAGLMRDNTNPDAFGSKNLPSVQDFERPWGSARYAHVRASAFPVAVFSGFAPQFTPLADMKNTWFAKLDEANPFFNASQGLVPWTWGRLKNPSHAREYQYKFPDSGLTESICQNFPDINDGFWLPNKAGTSQWLTFKMPAHAVQRLTGFSLMDVLMCSGRRDGTRDHSLENGQYGDKADAKVQYGVNGEPVGSAYPLLPPYIFTSCFALARSVPTLKQGDVFGFLVTKERANEAPVVGTMMIVGVKAA